MKKVITHIPNDKNKSAYVKILCEDVIEMEEDIYTLLTWIAILNEKENSPVTEHVYSAIDNLSTHLESFKRL